MTVSGTGATPMPMHMHDHAAMGGDTTSPTAADAPATTTPVSKALLYGGMAIAGAGVLGVLGSIPARSFASSKAATVMLGAGLGVAVLGLGVSLAGRHQIDAAVAASKPGKLPGGGTTTSDAAIPATVTGASGTLDGVSNQATVPKVELKTIAKDLGQLTQVTSAPGDDGLWLVEKSGKLLHRDDSGKVETRLDISSLVASGGEQGLLSVAFHPKFAQNGRLFVDYTDTNGDTHVAEAHADRNGTVDPDSLKDLFTVDQPYANHNGGQLQFGPDGMLYVGMGDGGSGGDPQDRAQDLGSKLGKILRVDVDNPDEGKNYGIPKDNPFVNTPGAEPEIYATGVRNPWRFSFDKSTGDLWIGDVGQSQWEEVDYAPRGQAKGANFGWNAREGAAPFAGGSTKTAPGATIDPALQYSHQEGASITGGYVYRGSDVPALKGWYVYSDIAKDTLRAMKVENGKVVGRAEMPGGRTYTVSFGESQKGELYAVTLGGELAKVVGASTSGTQATTAPTAPSTTAGSTLTEMTVQNNIMRFDKDEYHVKAGEHTFRLKNTDTSGMPHNVGVQGDGIRMQMSDFAFQGDTVELKVDLKPGTYELFCAPHIGSGMKAKLVVEE